MKKLIMAKKKKKKKFKINEIYQSREKIYKILINFIYFHLLFKINFFFFILR